MQPAFSMGCGASSSAQAAEPRRAAYSANSASVGPRPTAGSFAVLTKPHEPREEHATSSRQQSFQHLPHDRSAVNQMHLVRLQRINSEGSIQRDLPVRRSSSGRSGGPMSLPSSRSSSPPRCEGSPRENHVPQSLEETGGVLSKSHPPAKRQDQHGRLVPTHTLSRTSSFGPLVPSETAAKARPVAQLPPLARSARAELAKPSTLQAAQQNSSMPPPPRTLSKIKSKSETSLQVRGRSFSMLHGLLCRTGYLAVCRRCWRRQAAPGAAATKMNLSTAPRRPWTRRWSRR